MSAILFKRFALLFAAFCSTDACAGGARGGAGRAGCDGGGGERDVITFSQVREIVEPRIKSVRAQYPKVEGVFRQGDADPAGGAE